MFEHTEIYKHICIEVVNKYLQNNNRNIILK